VTYSSLRLRVFNTSTSLKDRLLVEVDLSEEELREVLEGSGRLSDEVMMGTSLCISFLTWLVGQIKIPLR
jgi:hypothetical protein